MGFFVCLNRASIMSEYVILLPCLLVYSLASLREPLVRVLSEFYAHTISDAHLHSSFVTKLKCTDYATDVI